MNETRLPYSPDLPARTGEAHPVASGYLVALLMESLGLASPERQGGFVTSKIIGD